MFGGSSESVHHSPRLVITWRVVNVTGNLLKNFLKKLDV